MNLKKIILSFSCIITLYSCADYSIKDSKKEKERQYYSSSGFALIYKDNLYLEKVINKKINNEDIKAMHNSLKTNTQIKIINPVNSKVIETKIYKKANYPKIFNIVLSEKIASILDLDLDNPFVEVIEVKKNKTFIAKEGSIFEEEKNVIEKVPVDEIKINDLTATKPKINKKLTKKNNFILVVSDFYYMDSANNLKNELLRKININNISVKKINNNKYRLLVGPFESFNALKTAYISLNSLGFEGLNVYNE